MVGAAHYFAICYTKNLTKKLYNKKGDFYYAI